MKFKCIQEFMDLSPECQHCGRELVTQIKSKNTPIVSQRYNMTFDNTIFNDPLEAEIKRAFSDKQDITYTSYATTNHLHFCYQIKGSINEIFAVHKTNNQIKGDRDKVQKVLWDHQPVIKRQCLNQSCIQAKTNYIADSSTMILERLSNTLYPFFLGTELLTISHRDDIYGLMTVHQELNSSFLMARHSMIKELPLMHLHKIKGSEAIHNKIKTLVTFS